MKTLKETLKEAGRYNDVIKILTKIISETEYDYSVDWHPSEGGCSCRVNGEDVREEATELLHRIIIGNPEGVINESIILENLYLYVKSITDTIEHNYVNALAHRKAAPDTSLDAIRSHFILCNLLLYEFMGMEFEDDDREWYIPDGWKAIELKPNERLSNIKEE